MKHRYIHEQMVAGLFSLLFVFSSCYDDEGNYSYKTLDEVKIDTVGLDIRSAYNIDRYDTLRLSPKVLFNGQEAAADAPLDYMWTMYNRASGIGVDTSTDTLSTDRELNAVISRPASTYDVQLTVTNRKTGVEAYFNVPVTVEENITGGWLVLYEKDGASDVGLIVNPLVKKNIIKNKELWDLYSSSNGNERLEGHPVRIQHTVVAMPNDAVIIATDRSMVGVNNGTFQKILSFEDFFFEPPVNGQLSYYGPSGVAAMGETVISNNKVYIASYMGNRNNRFGMPKSGDTGTLAPWSSDVRNPMFDAVVYDQDAGKFLFAPRGAMRLQSFAAQNPDAAFDVNNVGMKLVMGDWGKDFLDYDIMTKDGSTYLTIANFNTSNVVTPNVGQGLYDISNSPEIADIKTMAVPYVGEYLLYGAGSSVYNLKYNASTTAEKLWSAPSSDEKVTCVRLQKFYFRTLFLMMLPNANGVVHIATYNDKTGEGHLYQYRINPASGALLGEPIVYNVPGKVADMTWKYIME